jgi:hypothetical protein
MSSELADLADKVKLPDRVKAPRRGVLENRFEDAGTGRRRVERGEKRLRRWIRPGEKRGDKTFGQLVEKRELALGLAVFDLELKQELYIVSG